MEINLIKRINILFLFLKENFILRRDKCLTSEVSVTSSVYSMIHIEILLNIISSEYLQQRRYLFSLSARLKDIQRLSYNYNTRSPLSKENTILQAEIYRYFQSILNASDRFTINWIKDILICNNLCIFSK